MAATRKTAKTIRNLRGIPVHLRLSGQGEKPYRIQLNRRGLPGDTAEVPVACQQDTAFTKGIGMAFEIITKAEYAKLEYGPSGYQRQTEVEVHRDADNTLATLQVSDKGKVTDKATIERVRPNVVGDEPGSGIVGHDSGLGESFKSATDGSILGEKGSEFMPPQPTKLTITRTKG